MTILITGASGFIGSYIVQEGLDRGFEVWAGVRGTSSRGYLQDERIRFAQLDLSHPDALLTQLLQYKDEMGGNGWDYVVHAAGATKCLNEKDFYRTNTDGTRNLIDALRNAGMIPKRFVFVSSLSIFGAIREKPVRKPSEDNPWIYSPILLTDTPKPNTAYGAPAKGFPLHYPQTDGSLRTTREGLLHDGKKHPAAYRLCCRLQATGDHLCLYDGCRAGYI